MNLALHFLAAFAGCYLGIVIADKTLFYIRTGAFSADSEFESDVRVALRRFKERVRKSKEGK